MQKVPKIPSPGLFVGLFLCLVLCACQTIPDVDNGKVYLRGRGVAKYHEYGYVNKCKTAFGLDPDAFGMMVTAVSTQLTAQYPNMGKIGKRGGPYNDVARCIRVRERGKSLSIVVRAIDKCCGGSLASPTTHQLDLADDAFEKLAPLERGRLNVEWELVDCPYSLQIKSDGAVCDDPYYFRI